MKRRGFTLIHVLTWLPLVAVITTVSARFIIQTMRIERAAVEQINTEARMDDILRRLREDAAHAVDVDMEKNGRLRLTFRSETQSIVYEVHENQIMRVEKNTDGTSSYAWTLVNMFLHLQIEKVGPSARLAWITFEQHSHQEIHRGFRMSAAVTIGTGGAK